MKELRLLHEEPISHAFFPFFFVLRSLFLGTRSFVQRHLWKEQNLLIKTKQK